MELFMTMKMMMTTTATADNDDEILMINKLGNEELKVKYLHFKIPFPRAVKFSMDVTALECLFRNANRLNIYFDQRLWVHCINQIVICCTYKYKQYFSFKYIFFIQRHKYLCLLLQWDMVQDSSFWPLPQCAGRTGPRHVASGAQSKNI